MKKSFLILLAGGFLALYSCSDKNTEAEDATTVPSDQAVTTDGAVTTAPAETGILPTDGSMPSDPAAAPVPDAAATAPGMNPPHGQPGHDCAIAVGAPLSSAPKTAPGSSSPAVLPGPGQAPTTQRIEMPVQGSPAPTSVMTAPAPGATPAATTTAPGMNPPHGQPGHDCAVAVGAPLKK
jgi:hypothetical protein